MNLFPLRIALLTTPNFLSIRPLDIIIENESIHVTGIVESFASVAFSKYQHFAAEKCLS